jgi:CheY-like chemotaxis protein
MNEVTVSCARCSGRFDGLTASWCHCVTTMISMVCPRCGFCICREPQFTVRSFWRTAPAALVAAREAEESRRAAARSAVPLATVLVVDDDDEIRAIAEYALKELGFLTLTASCAEEALAIVHNQKPQVVLTDALMPRIDGRELCLRIKKSSPATKVIVMTSLYKSARYASEARRVFQADDYLAKPIDFQLLKRILMRVLQEAA